MEHSVREVDSYLEGGHMTFTDCDSGYTLQGNTEYDCEQVSDAEAAWQPSPDAYCKGTVTSSYMDTEILVTYSYFTK